MSIIVNGFSSLFNVNDNIGGINGLVKELSGGSLTEADKLLFDVSENEDLVSHKYETAFNDYETLKKTLTEHGCNEFKIQSENNFTCKLEQIEFSFEKAENSVYTMSLKCSADTDADDIVGCLGEEYSLNAQESTYMKIKEGLEHKNLKISEEEILEDDSILLTVNID